MFWNIHLFGRSRLVNSKGIRVALLERHFPVRWVAVSDCLFGSLSFHCIAHVFRHLPQRFRAYDDSSVERRGLGEGFGRAVVGCYLVVLISSFTGFRIA